MRQWLDWAGKLYPKAWRDRYGLEFDGLLSDVQLHWSDLFDVLRGAAVMQVRSMSTYLKLACAVTLAGMVLALAASFTVPMPYMSSALIRVAPDEPGRGGADPQLPDSLNRAWLNVTSRSSLAELILRPSLDLYRSARNRKPLEEVIADMKRDIRIETIDASDPAATFRVSFMYPDRYKAQAVADALTMRLRSAPALSGDFLVVQRANLPETPLTQYRLAYLGWGLGLGALCGAVAASLRWRAKWTLQVIGCSFAGWLITLLVVFNGFIYLERPLGWYTSNALVECL